MNPGSTTWIALLTVLTAGNAAVAQQKPWKGSADVGANVLYGASRSRLASVALGGSRADSTLELRSDFVLTYADARVDDEPRRVTARSWRVSLGGDHTPRQRLSPFWFTSAEASLQQRLERRYGAGAGAKLTFYRKQSDDVSTSLALLWEHTRALKPDSTTPRTRSRARWSLRGRMRHQLGPVVKFTHVTFYQPAVDELSAYVVDSNTSLAVTMTSAWSLTASWRERFDSEARDRGARSNHDGQVLLGVRLSTP